MSCDLIRRLQDGSNKKVGTKEILRFNTPDIAIIWILEDKCSDEREAEFSASAGLLDYIGQESISTHSHVSYQTQLQAKQSTVEQEPTLRLQIS